MSAERKAPDVHTQYVLDRVDSLLAELIWRCGEGTKAGLKGLIDDARRVELRGRAEALLLLLRVVRNDLSSKEGPR